MSTTVYTFFQDRTGYLWTATTAGLSRFDGQHFVNFARATNGKPFGIILSFAQTADGHIWASGNGSGLFEFDGQQFIHHTISPKPGSNLITALYEIAPNKLLIGTEQGIFLKQADKLHSLLPDIRMMRTFKASASGEFFKVPDGRIRLLFDGAIYYLNPQTGTLSQGITPPAPNDHFDWSQQLADGRLLVGCVSQQRVYVFKDKQLQHTLNFPTCQPQYAIEDSKGTVWITTNQGLIKIDQRTFSMATAEWITTQNGLPFSAASAIFFDREHNLWLGSYGKGIYKLEETETYRFPYPFAAGLGCTDDKGRLWYSTPTGLQVIERKPNGSFSSRTIMPVADTYFKTMGLVKALPGNELWIGTDDGHLANFHIEDHNNGDLRLHFRREIGPRTGFSALKKAFLHIDRKGRLWVSDKEKPMLYVLNCSHKKPRIVKRLAFDPGRRQSNGRHLLEDAAGNFWFAYERHSIQIFDARLNPVPLPFELPRSTEVEISSVHQDREGAYWFTTDNHGLIRRTPDGKVYSITQKEGLLSDQIVGIMEGADKTLWVSTWVGLNFIKYNGKDLQLSETQEVTEGPIWSMGTFSDGMGWLATNFEVVFHKKSDSRTLFRPSIVLNKLFINGEQRPSNQGDLQLSANENNLLFEFGSVYFRGWGNLRFRWKLEGSGYSQWSSPSSTESVNFAGLEPGRYTFWVKTISADGLESSQPVRFAFEIVPPIWKRWWFLLISLLILTTLAYFLIRIRVKRLLEIERLRARIAADLHDDIGSGLTRISLATEMLLRQKNINNDPAQIALFQRMGLTARELIEAMSDIVWSIDPKNDYLGKVIERIQIFANDISDAKGIGCTFSLQTAIDNTAKKLGSDIVSSMVLIAKEALTNTARHAQCQHLSVNIESSANHLRLSVSDDGVGFDESKLPRMNGLINMRRRAEKAGGQLTIFSAPAQGTKVIVEFSLL